MSQFIVVEGLIGVGKSSLCRLLGQAWDAQLYMEPAEDNPFLEPFYSDPERFAFPAQMFYLSTRWAQQERIRQGDLFKRRIVSDYHFEKDRLFALKTLNDSEMQLYDRFAELLHARAPTPDLLIWLHAPMETIQARIVQRAAPGEDKIVVDYLVDLAERYERWLGAWDRCPVLRLDNSQVDYVNDPKGQRHVLRLVEDALDGKLPEAPGSPDREAQPSLFGS